MSSTLDRLQMNKQKNRKTGGKKQIKSERGKASLALNECQKRKLGLKIAFLGNRKFPPKTIHNYEREILVYIHFLMLNFIYKKSIQFSILVSIQFLF